MPSDVLSVSANVSPNESPPAEVGAGVASHSRRSDRAYSGWAGTREIVDFALVPLRLSLCSEGVQLRLPYRN